MACLSRELLNQNLRVKDQDSLKFQNDCLRQWLGIWPCFKLLGTELCFNSCVCFSWCSWPLPPCKLTAIIPYCQPTTLHEFLLFYLLAPNAVVPKLFVFSSRTHSWKLVFRQMPIKSIQSQSHPNGTWLTEAPSQIPRLHGEHFQNNWNNATFWQILPQFQRQIPYLL